MTPSAYGGLFAGAAVGTAKESKTAAATFFVPAEIATNKDDVAKYSEQLEFCVRNGYSHEEFVERCRDEGLAINVESLHVQLFEELVKLDKANKNGVRARIIKNAFAPLFVGKVDVVAGNPPWVNWSNLPASYRSETADLWRHYSLFPHKGLRARSGSAMDDVSVLMTYVGMDNYLAEQGHLGFVITQSVFRTEGGGEGFRHFKLPGGDGLRVAQVCDMSSFQPFDGVANRTATLILQKGAHTRFPVSYHVWKARLPIGSDNTLEEVLEKVRISHCQARPVSPEKVTSPWIVGSARELSGAGKCFGPSPYQGRYGTHCHASGIFWVELLRELASKKALIRNLGDAGKTKYPIKEHRVDRRFVFPLARGRDVDRWSVSPSCWMVLAQDEENSAKAASEKVLKRDFPDTFAYFKLFEKELRNRSGYRQFFKPGVDPFYSVYNVGPYTFAPYKVLWREVAQDLRAAVSDGSIKSLVADHTLVTVSTETLDEAHFLCAMLNSSPSNFIVSRYVALHPAPHILKYICVPKFAEKNARHRTLAELSRKCHEETATENTDRVEQLEAKINHTAAEIWGLTEEELTALSLC